MSDELSGIITLTFYVDQSGNLTTATPVDLPIAGAYHKGFTMPQDGCLRAIVAQCETTPNTANPDLVCSMTADGTEDATGTTSIAIGATENYATFANGEVPIAKDVEVGASIMQTGGTIDDAVDETIVTLLVQLGRSNI